MLILLAILLHALLAQGFVVTRTTAGPRPCCYKSSLTRTAWSFHQHHPVVSLPLILATSSSNSRQTPSRRSAIRRQLGNLIKYVKRWIQKRKRYSVHVLECQGNKFFVGSTKSRKRRLNAHFGKHGGCHWTRMHTPIRIVKEYRRIPKGFSLGKEAQVTAEFMLKHGVNNVRGAMFSETRMYTLNDLEALTRFLCHHNNIQYAKMEAMLRAELPPAPKQEHEDDTNKEMGTVYVLECQDNKFYVGCTKNSTQRLHEHFTGRGSRWTQRHTPISIAQEYNEIPVDYCLAKEAQVTAEFMLEHGVNNVRGAMFVETRVYTHNDLAALTGFLGHYNDLNYKDIEQKLRMELTGNSKNRRKKRKSKARQKQLVSAKADATE